MSKRDFSAHLEGFQTIILFLRADQSFSWLRSPARWLVWNTAPAVIMITQCKYCLFHHGNGLWRIVVLSSLRKILKLLFCFRAHLKDKFTIKGKCSHYPLTLIAMETSGEALYYMKHFWSFTAKRRCSVLLNSWGRCGTRFRGRKLFCFEAPEMFCLLQNFIHLSTNRIWLANDWISMWAELLKDPNQLAQFHSQKIGK